MFELDCYPSCANCYKLSNNPDNQQCIKCRDSYYFVEGTNNCYQYLSGYYSDPDTQTFKPCSPDCEECSAGPNLETKSMNCISCKEGFHLFESTNCLSCPSPLYVNPELTECIDEIPLGYYLENRELRTLGRCHSLCKTCLEGPQLWSMNCIECKYHDSKFIPAYDGDCPTEDEEDEEEVPMPGGECPRKKPILIRNDFCMATYCSPEDMEQGTCIISNSIAKVQWMNNIQRFGDNFKSSNLAYGPNGELLLFAQKRETNDFQNMIYFLDEQGRAIIYDEKENDYTYFKTLQFLNDKFFENVRVVRNPENNEIFILSTQIEKEMYEIDFWEDENYIHSFESVSSSSLSLFPLRNDSSIFFTSFIHCVHEKYGELCYPYLRLFKFESNNVITILKEYRGQEDIDPTSNLMCIQHYENYIQCIYIDLKSNLETHQLALFNSETLFPDYIFDLDVFVGNNISEYFDSMISLNDDAFVVAYSTETNSIIVDIQTIEYDILNDAPIVNDYISDIPHIVINEDYQYNFEDGSSKRNNLCKINDYKFAMLLNSIEKSEKNSGNSNIIIYIFTILSNKENVSVKKYSIDFRLYGMANYGNIMGYTLGQFFGILIDLSAPGDKNVMSSAFMTFGYINTTESSVLYDRDFIDLSTGYSKSISFTQYIGRIENNLFGYSFLGVIILDLPYSEVGDFVKSNDEKITLGEILPVTTEIKFKLNQNYNPGNYSFAFAGVAKEPDYDNMKKLTEEILIYPEDSEIDERQFYTPEVFYGKRLEFFFEIQGEKGNVDEKCYPSCETCSEKSVDDENHFCLTCKPGYYFKEYTSNCYKELAEYYYFDEDKQKFFPCYLDCLSCDAKEIDTTHMNCLSCSGEKVFYGKTKNCLNCPKYVNYEQTGCIDEIPEGYHLLDERLKTIEKCYPLCKTCKSGPSTLDDILHMNCETCKYTREDFIPPFEGNCPDSDSSGSDEPVDGQCPKDKPILQENKCKMIYCTKEEFDKGTCKVYNQYTSIQWLTNFHIFDDLLTNYITVDRNDKGELFLVAQNKQASKNIYYLYGFDKNGRGIIYDKSINDYTSFKATTYELPAYIEKIKHVEIDDKKYLVNILKAEKIYLINYNDNEISETSLTFTPYSVDTVTKLKNKENIYFFDFIYCTDEYVYENCYLGFLNYKISKNVFILDKTNINTESLIKVDYDSRLTCFQNSFNQIQCKYYVSTDDEFDIYKQQVVELFNADSFASIYRTILDKIAIDEMIFESMIELKDNICVIAYSIESNVIKVLIKSLELDENYKYHLQDAFASIPQILINEDSSYQLDHGTSFRNSLFKLSENEFVMLLNNFRGDLGYSNVNSGMIIITFTIFNSNKNIILRHYKINFTLYNRYVGGDLMGYQLNGFFGVLMELTSPTQKYLDNAAFLTFGYVNATEDVSVGEGSTNLITNKKTIKVNDYIKGIENNLFGYTLAGVKILSLPEESSNFGYFANIKNYNLRINVNDIIKIDSELSLNLNSNAKGGKYYISFAGVVKEPEYQRMNNFANKIELYPEGASAVNYPEPKTLIGKEFRYNFEIQEKKCFDNCATCIRFSNNVNEQECLTCKNGFYFKDGTRNCYNKIDYQYYFNKQTNSFSPCYKDCYTCQEKETNSTHMNCLSCHNLYKLYQKTSNCLKCPKYVNYEQTGCIDTIPEGYFLADQNSGEIDKCHQLCKTCKSRPLTIGNQFHMNCETCLYKDPNYISNIEGNCPSKEGQEQENKRSSTGTYVLVTIIIIIVLVLIVGGIIYYKKKQSNYGQPRQKMNTDYYNIGGKNIPFDEEQSFGIN
jgi:hypothetical protein